MPHSTHNYLFESKILKCADELSQILTGGNRSFIIECNEDGVAQKILFSTSTNSLHSYLEALNRVKTPYIFYDPFDAPEYTWMCWSGIARSTMERLIGSAFEKSDFIPQNRALHELKAEATFPVCWDVMF